jgi:hypothetical protein
MSKHTPTPWSFGGYSSYMGVQIMAQPDPKKNTIIIASTRSAQAEEPKAFREEVEANAAHIVHCVNAYPDLVEALKEIAGSQYQTAIAGEVISVEFDHQRIARAALDKAKVKP